MAYSALAVANAFIELGREEGSGCEPITPMKLQKLLYYANAWHLFLKGKPLINESFEKWKFGPVVPSVYYEFRGAGASVIKALGTRISERDGTKLIAPIVQREDKYVWKLLAQINRKYGNMDGVALSALSHRPDGAWAKTAKINEDISDDLIKAEIEAQRGAGN